MADPNKNAFGLINLGDVRLNEPIAPGDVLKYNAASNKWENNTDVGSNTYAGLTDTDVTALVDGEMTYYDAGSGKWKNTRAVTSVSVSPA